MLYTFNPLHPPPSPPSPLPLSPNAHTSPVSLCWHSHISLYRRPNNVGSVNKKKKGGGSVV